MSLCTICKAICHQAPPPVTRGNTTDETMALSGLPYHADSAELHESAKSCDLCRAVVNMAKPNRSDFDSECEKNLQLVITGAEDLPVYTIYWRHERHDDGDDPFLDSWQRLVIISTCADHSSRSPLFASQNKGVWPQQKSIVASPFTTVQIDHLNESLFNLGARWIRDCLKNHTDCRKNKMKRLPRRVLDVSGSQICLRDFSSERFEQLPTGYDMYAALSYRWGDGTFIHLNRSNRLRLQDHIPWADLPTCFQDAVEWTRRLSIRYLWIDALCICQDDKEDWANEASRMSAIYQNALVTFAAGWGQSPADGLRLNYAAHEWVKVDRETEENQDFFVQVLRPGQITGVGETYQSEALDSRGWTMQERYMSPLYLLFGESKLQFECDEHFLSSHGVVSDPRFSLIFQPREEADDVQGLLGSSGRLQYQPEAPYSFAKWRELVEEYTTRTLTRATDRLPALSGLAKIFASHFHPSDATYMAGIWSKDIARSLMWYTHQPHTAPADPEISEYIAPSWSWASCLDAVWFYAESPYFRSTIWGVQYDPTYIMNDQLGALSAASLRFAAPIAPATMQLRDHVSAENISLPDDIDLRVEAFRGRDEPLNIRLDRFVGCQKDLSNLLNHPIAAVCHVSASKRVSLWLILAVVRRPQLLFRRVGCFQTSKFDHEELSVKMITIV